MKQFEGNINGKVYTDKNEFDKALLSLDKTDNVYVAYKYINVPDVKGSSEPKDIIGDNNYVSENLYVKNITNKKDVELDVELMSKLKCASNKSSIKETVCNKIASFDSKISDNLLHINELKSDYKKLEEKMKLINGQIRTLDDANNNYYLNKEYYTNIKNLLETVNDSEKSEVPETNPCGCNCELDCECGQGCKCGEHNKCEKKKEETISLDKYDNATKDIAKYLNKMNIHNLSDLVDYFLKKY